MGEFLGSYGLIDSFSTVMESFIHVWPLHIIEARPDFTVNWSLILFSSVELFLISETKI